MPYLALAVFPAALLIAAYNDAVDYKIPNWISILLVCTFPIAVVSTGVGLDQLWQGMGIGVIMLLVGFALFAFNIAGGGDGKLLAAAAPWFGLHSLLYFLLATTVVGGLLALAILLFRGLPIMPIYARYNWLMDLHQTDKGIPYGVAIAIGGLCTFPETKLFAAVFGG